MKKLLPPTMEDIALLDQIIRHETKAVGHPLVGDISSIRIRYGLYIDAKGDSWAVQCPEPIDDPNELQRTIAKRYHKPISFLAYISRIRDSSPDICPMCGSLNSGTVDHVFPKEYFPDLAVFSRNLVPACARCNSARKTNYKGAQQGERVLHPYFDSVMDERVIRARITAPDGHFESPIIDLEVALPTTHQYYAAAKYHMQNVVRQAGILNWMEKRWINILRQPEVFIPFLEREPLNIAAVTRALTRTLIQADQKYGTPNNWESMLFAGILNTASAVEAIFNVIVRLQSGGLQAEDV